MRFFRPMAVFFIFLSGLYGALGATSVADGPHVHVQLVVPESQLSRARKNAAGLYFKLDTGWHVYWLNAGDSGEPPHIHWTLPEGVTAGALQFPAPKRLPLGPLMDFGYENEVLFPLTLDVAKTAKTGPAVLHAKVDWLVCREVCIPGRAELETSRDVSGLGGKATPVDPDSGLYRRLSCKLPKPLPAGSKVAFQPGKEGFRLEVATGQRETTAAFFPADLSVLDNPAPQKFTATADGLILDLKKAANLAANPAQLRGVLELSGGRAFEVVALSGSATASGDTAAESTTSAPVTAPPSSSAPAATPSASALLPAAPTKAPVASKPAMLPFSWLVVIRTAGLAFLGGLILNLMPCVFPVLFLKGLALVQSGNEERHKMRGHGLVYAVGILVSFWVLVAVLLGLRAAGSTLGWGFQFQSPVFLGLMAGLLFFLGLSLAGQFEIGLTLTSAGGSLAAKQGYTGCFFTGVLAVVVATPCTAPFMGAAIGYALAQPPGVTFAVFTAIALGLAAPYVALTLQPAWTRMLPRPGVWMEVLKQAVSVPIFATVIWLAWVLTQAYGANLLVALLGGFLLLAVAGWFLGRWPAKRWSTAVAAVMVCGVIAVNVLAPKRLVVQAAEPASPAEAQAQGPSQSHWEVWSPEVVVRYQAQGRPVFVDFTASWCLSCQVNERVALQQSQVQQAFQAANVALLRADWTRHDEAIANALTALGRSGVPAYALYVPGQSAPQMLPEVLTPGIVTDALGKLPTHGPTPARGRPNIAVTGGNLSPSLLIIAKHELSSNGLWAESRRIDGQPGV